MYIKYEINKANGKFKLECFKIERYLLDNEKIEIESSLSSKIKFNRTGIFNELNEKIIGLTLIHGNNSLYFYDNEFENFLNFLKKI